MPAYGSSSRGSLVLSEGIKLNFLTILANANLASIKANLIPMQPLGPCPNGKYAYLQRPNIFSQKVLVQPKIIWNSFGLTEGQGIGLIQIILDIYRAVGNLSKRLKSISVYEHTQLFFDHGQK